jgi:enhancing lycopene biosynthesis protein 2
MTKVAVILSGSGYLDGAEIRESVLALYFLDKYGAEVSIFAPDIEQMHVINHLTGEATPESRNVLIEAARIARGQIENIDQLNVNNFDALVIPGGFGVAKNLSSLAVEGAEATVLQSFKTVILAFLETKKPIGAICIAPAVLALAVKGSATAKLTIGDDEGTAGVITSTGCSHKNAATNEMVYDTENKIASCSAYMREDSIAAVGDGIEKVIKQVLDAV